MVLAFLGAVYTPAGEELAVYDSSRRCLASSPEASDLLGGPSGFYRGLPLTLKLIDAIVEGVSGGCVSLDSRLPPPLRPRVLWGVGRSFKAHAAEMGMEARIAFFVKSPYSVIGHREEIVLPFEGARADYEGEIAVVIGRRLRNASPREAAEAIAGFTAVNDVTERRLQEEMSWSIAKSMDTFAPLGPLVALVESYRELENLCVETRLNGERVQSGCTSDMVAGIHEIVARLSSLVTLRPGDVVMMGTPPGVGHARSPPRYLRPGDTVEVEVKGLPALVNAVSGAEG